MLGYTKFISRLKDKNKTDSPSAILRKNIDGEIFEWKKALRVSPVSPAMELGQLRANNQFTEDARQLCEKQTIISSFIHEKISPSSIRSLKKSFKEKSKMWKAIFRECSIIHFDLHGEEVAIELTYKQTEINKVQKLNHMLLENLTFKKAKVEEFEDRYCLLVTFVDESPLKIREHLL